MMKKQVGAVWLIAALVFGLIAVSTSAQDETPSIGFVRFAHTIPDVGAVDIFEGDSAEPIVDDLEYGEYTQLYLLPVTGEPFVLRSAANGDVLFTLAQGVTGNYTALVVAAGDAESLSVILEPLNIIRNDIDGAARIRTINLVRGSETLDVQLESDGEIATDIGYIGLTDVDITPVTTDLTVTAPDGSVVYEQAGIEFEADTHYAIVVYGDASDLESVEAMIIPTPQETTRVQFIHNGDRALDLYQSAEDETPFVANLQPGTTTEFFTLPSRAYTFIVREVGAGVAGQQLAGLAYQFYPARDLVVEITGGDPLAVNLVTEVVTPDDVLNAILNPDMMEATPEADMTPEATPESTPSS